MATARIANIIVDTLASIGVKRVYGVPGDSLNGITDAIRTHKSVAWIHTRNEETAAFAVEPRLTLRETWPFAPEAAVRATRTLVGCLPTTQ
jgi:pyruvate dehydrogenase (quinone)